MDYQKLNSIMNHLNYARNMHVLNQNARNFHMAVSEAIYKNVYFPL